MRENTVYTKPSYAIISAFFLIAAVSIIFIGSLIYQSQAKNIRAEVGQRLSSIAHTKSAVMQRWARERKADIRTLCENRVFQGRVRQLCDNPANPGFKQDIGDWLELYQRHYRYKRIYLFDVQSTLVFSVPEVPESKCPLIGSASMNALRSGEPVFMDFHFHETGSSPHLAFVAPVFDQQRALGVVVFEIDAAAYLYPLIKSWPTPSDTAETLLVRRDGDSVIFLNDLRFKKRTALALRISLSRTDVPAVRAVLGDEGIMVGTDYRGEQVIADMHPVPGLPWFMIARMDTDEVYAPIRRQARAIIFQVGLLICVIGLVLVFYVRQRRLWFYRARAQDAQMLQEKNDQLNQLFESMFNAFVLFESVFDDEGRFISYRFVYINKAFERITGVLNAEVAGRTVHDVWPATESEWISRYGEVAVTGIPQIFDLYHAPTSKMYHCVVYRPGDSQERFCVIFEDITERSLAERALQASEFKYRTLMENLTAGVVVYEPDTTISYSNPRASLLFGLTNEQLMGKSALDPCWLFLREDGAPCSAAEYPVNMVLATGEPLFDYSVGLRYDANAETVWLLCNAYPERDADNNLLHIVVTFVDISEQRIASKISAVQAKISSIILTYPTEEMYTKVLEILCDAMQSPLGVFGYCDEDGDLIVPTMIGQVWDKCRVASKTTRFPRASWGSGSWARALREQKANCINEISLKTPEGHLAVDRHVSMPIVCSGQAVGIFQVANKAGDYTGEDMYVLQCVTDYVAPILNAWLERQRFERKLQLRNEELSQFSFAISHDLRSPLVTIQTFMGYLEKDIKKQDPVLVERDFNLMSSAADKMGRMLDELLALIRVGRVCNPEVSVPLQTVVREALDMLSGCIAERGVRVGLPEEQVMIRGDRPRLVELFQNLVANAVKFMGDQEKPVIEIGFETVRGEVELFVRDNGEGIDPRYQDKIFTMFEKIDPGTEGIGMGLALVKRIVTSHGGTVRVESGGPGTGTCFRFILPGRVAVQQ